ncbi:fatty acid desaturase family protein [Haloglycomyces albus]|uniref:fatty acid desaturase family protein n=1 Tax=Haloglycomyces albus TaxID=526067 RepID=UPI0004B325AB|nr:fatty acid desaturase family protein [Haloglycomyces albus]
MTKGDNWHAPIAIAADLIGIAVAIALCVTVSWWFYPLALIYIGSTQRGFVNLLHESTHKILAKNNRFNLLLGTVFSGYLVFHLYNPYRTSHIGFHHRYLGDPDKDPDYSFHREVGIYDHDPGNRNFFLRNIGLALLGFRTFAYVKYVVEDRLLFRDKEAKVSMPVKMGTERAILLLQWAVIFGVCAYFGWLHLLLLLWFVPLFTTAIAIGWLTELAEHYPLPESESSQILMTRNRHGWALERYLFGRHNDNYHLVHHLNTGIPFWNMKKAHKVLLNDPAYRRWDGLWAGILTRGPQEGNKETLITYASKYRDWKRSGSDPKELRGQDSFATAAAMAAAL